MTKSSLYGLGRRKTAVARVILLPDEKSHTVNEQPVNTYFTTVDMQHSAVSPLILTSQLEQFGFKARIQGGGKRAQADALKLALARALLEVDANFRKQLKEARMLERDSRMKERKKFGLKRARRAPQFSKR